MKKESIVIKPARAKKVQKTHAVISKKSHSAVCDKAVLKG